MKESLSILLSQEQPKCVISTLSSILGYSIHNQSEPSLSQIIQAFSPPLSKPVMRFIPSLNRSASSRGYSLDKLFHGCLFHYFQYKGNHPSKPVFREDLSKYGEKGPAEGSHNEIEMMIEESEYMKTVSGLFNYRNPTLFEEARRTRKLKTNTNEIITCSC